MHPSPQQVIETASRLFSTPVADLLGKRRMHPLVEYRQVTMAVIKSVCLGHGPDGGISFPEVGRAMGRDHTTVMHAVQKIEGSKRLMGMAQRLTEHVDEYVLEGSVMS